MAKNKMGFEGQIYYGTAGSTASTQLTNARDITFSMEPSKGDTTVRGTGASPPIGSARVTRRDITLEFSMLHDNTDSALEALRTAAFAATPVAIRLIDEAGGKGFDGDVNLTPSEDMNMAGEQIITFTCDPNRELREPTLYT